MKEVMYLSVVKTVNELSKDVISKTTPIYKRL
jgi:hypothetical protein